MKLPPFEQGDRKWDDYKAFHTHVAMHFVQFETGELIYTASTPDPDNRHIYNKVGVQIVATTDNDCPRLYGHDDEPIPSAWLSRDGMQYLAIDLEQKVAVRLMRHRWRKDNPTKQDMQVPQFLENRFSAYWSAPGRNPIAAPIAVAPPKKFTKEERDQLQGLKDQCAAWCAIHNIEPLTYRRTIDLPESGKRTVVDATAVNPMDVLNVSMLALTEVHRIQIASCGYAPAFDKQVHKFLKVK